jgi:hypothetical protein
MERKQDCFLRQERRRSMAEDFYSGLMHFIFPWARELGNPQGKGQVELSSQLGSLKLVDLSALFAWDRPNRASEAAKRLKEGYYK